ncbi:DnaD domain protein [Lentilactobacillus hilgardii]|uniref:Replication initiation and membrane attachment protein, DnaB/DnaD family n=1 Tax=Lentilactobacillus hilgardii (strain ATCC 8290 / DSM 20176 / CCUG 30140 / JCM 1155 / KCTC 3500 / NBRC 15886 / NCIMB 8040 / NRRL B-1843 / 9) TaxID=1423757 RepID=C0XMD3_LENH9|nr:DnaD domain protein [Lentilactobacillus hilgardii]EEI23481.1 replication initiation and membrane attachment protein, DnaB/DnaD family [Lentilactobacillus hilgardii DSM 20176 = ATCC 8290]KRK58393.1 replication initiation and membrane attachment protein DnaB [Lentilactobacillus hilgardii DSM 20176 = ATCC 8290]QEU38739.1 DNA replication protein DnaD [Lentilactobacillus hilgardii]TDG81844.1 hypothetical protein C5L34_001665 [Lentilactobacillus hilgardii]
MLNSENKLTPDSKYLVLNASANKSVDQSVLTNLYLPIIGRGAVQLYNLLWSLSVSDHNRLILHKHFELQSILDIGIDKLLRYRRKLEAVNLLVTSVSLTSPDSYVYSMREPCTATEFLKTDILSILLLGRVGEDTYNRIVARLFIPMPDVGQVKNVSASLLDVFQIPENSVKNIPGPVNIAKQTISGNSAELNHLYLEASKEEFDFNLLLDILENSYVDAASVKAAQPLILSEYSLYGIDEIKMGELIKKATNLNTNKLNQKSLKFIIARDFTQPQVRVTDSINKNPEDDADAQQLVQQFDQPTQQVIQISKENAPISFLKQIKDQKGGMVTAGEQRMIRELVSKGLLPREVINVLIYYVLIGIGNSTLNQNLVNTIADNWAQHHVTNAEKAILQVQKRAEEKQEKETQRSRRRYSSGGRRQITETLPDWAKKEKQQTKEASKKAKQSAEQQKTGPDEAERKRVNEELAELRKRKEKRGEN